MDKLDGKTFDVVQENIEKMKEIFPDIFTEGKIDMDKFMLTLGEHVEKDKERYDFTWNGKTEAIQLAQKQTTGTLRPCKEESVDWDTTQNLYIEGDNLEVLRILQNSYRNKVKMIYIDPPYNTGNDFVYHDDFKDNIRNYKKKNEENMKTNAETNGRYHTDWLNLMYPRLKLSKNLLKENGVIFISIDDNELTNLKKICDEVFGEQNFVAQITTLCNPKGRSQDKFFATNHEYILVYSKSFLNKGYFSVKKDDRQLEKDYKEIDQSGRKYRLIELRNTHREFGKHNRKNLHYPIYVDESTGNISMKHEEDFLEVLPNWDDGFEGCWTWDRTKATKDIDLLEARKTRNGLYKIYRRSYADGAVRMLKTIFNDKSFYTEKGQQEIYNLFKTKYKIFESPKSVDLIKQLIETVCEDNDIILDFFSGSATSAHSVMKLQSKNNLNVRYILVQLPELTDVKSEAYKAGYKTISDIGKERIRRAGNKIIEEDNITDNLDKGFKVFKLDETNLRTWDEESLDLEKDLMDMIDPVKEGRTQDDVVYEVLLKYGIDLTVPIEQKNIAGRSFYDVGMGYLLICLERNLTLDVIEKIAKLNPTRVVFYDEGFKDDTVRTNAQQILKRHKIEDIRVI
ncbi:site-specific DNA-methyltransferase [Aquibacillus kalidii]|uniref:site-specific DNA-methyltransferase n=1 Tax=Aquibacillus kalidii TaxID=2762597 RepID=UPI001645D248|nr:site-specific DNA-methyltransferase [Aquibacillus kalidii]